jgi:acetyl-CoA carboxylase carboxyltransferase component
MASKHIRTDMNFAYPTAEIAVMGPDGAVNIVYRKELSEAADVAEERSRRIQEFKDRSPTHTWQRSAATSTRSSRHAIREES